MDQKEKTMELIEKTLDLLIESGNGGKWEYVQEATNNIFEIRKMMEQESEETKERPKLNDFMDGVHENAVKHGWWTMAPSFPEVIALCHSELSEALEEYRKDGGMKMVYYEDGVPHGIAFELADTILRILDYCGHMGIDIEQCLEEKNKFNQNRPYRHGGKII